MKATTISIIIAIILIGGAIMFARGDVSYQIGTDIPANNVNIADGKQIIEIRAKGGYQPRKSMAKAGVPTVLRFNTDGTFDCSSSVHIPSLNISKALPSSGHTDIYIGAAEAGTLRGSCGMGMYSFEIVFQS